MLLVELVAVLFFQDDGGGGTKKIWVLGNLEEVARGKSTVDAGKALGSGGADYLLQLDKDYMPKGVHIDDPNALFIFRWYREVDGAGKVLAGYQNRRCASYKLPLDNDGLPFFWTSNVQCISKRCTLGSTCYHRALMS